MGSPIMSSEALRQLRFSTLLTLRKSQKDSYSLTSLGLRISLLVIAE